jgi:hypothetical protein
VNGRPENEAALDAIGFVWDSVQHRFDAIYVPALRWYAAENCGDMDVPQDLLLGEGACRAVELPPHVTEFRLGQTVSVVRSHKRFVDGRPENEAALDAIGFVWDSSQHRFDAILMPALRWYAAEHRGNMDVRQEFVLGEEACRAAKLPPHVTEYRLGQTVRDVRSRKDFVHGRPENEAALDAIGFVWASGEKRGGWNPTGQLE